MADPRFFRLSGPFRLDELAEMAGAEIVGDTENTFNDVRHLEDAGPTHVSFLDNKQYVDAFTKSGAGACIVRAEFAERAPRGMSLLITPEPYMAYARVASAFYPAAPDGHGISPSAHVDPRASIGANVRIMPGAVIFQGAEVGDNSIIGANAVIGHGCVIGTNCQINANAALSHCLIGDRVIVHHGVSIGQDGFGFASNADGHTKVPQLGRVIIEDDVEIGANTTIDRGAGPDTVIGAGTMIDNLVQIAHNVQIGRNCVIVSQVGISGSTKIGDFVVIGGQAGFTGHLEIGSGSQFAARSGVMRNVEPGSILGGAPAKPIREWMREIATLERLAKAKGTKITKTE